MESENIWQNKKEESELKADYIRHAPAEYKTYLNTLASDTPNTPFNYKEQITPDINEQALEFAKRAANEYFEKLDPEKDILFFTASNEARAIETANMYRTVAHDRGFEVIRPDNPRSDYAETLGEGEIRMVDSLSVNPNNMLTNMLFAPKSQYDQLVINWEKVSEEDKQKIEEIRSIVEKDNKGTWLQNVIEHGEEVDRVFPENNTTIRTYGKQFEDLLRLLRFARSKAATLESNKELRLLAFAHENAVTPLLQEHFDKQGIKNCECIEFTVNTAGEVAVEFRGNKKSI